MYISDIDEYDIHSIITFEDVDYIVTMDDVSKKKILKPYSQKIWHNDIHHIVSTHKKITYDIDEDFFKEFISELYDSFPDMECTKEEEFEMCKLFWISFQKDNLRP